MNKVCRNDDYCEFNVSGYIGYGWVGFHRGNRFRIRIHGIDSTFEVFLQYVAEELIADAPRTARGADYGNGMGFEEGLHRGNRRDFFPFGCLFCDGWNWGYIQEHPVHT